MIRINAQVLKPSAIEFNGDAIGALLTGVWRAEANRNTDSRGSDNAGDSQ